MDRLISEQAVFEAFREYQGSISDFYKAIKAIPSAYKGMTKEEREQAIEVLKEVKEDYWEDDGYGYATADCQRVLTTLDMTIEALAIPSAEPYKGRTNGEVLHKIFPNDLWLHIYARRAKKNADWWNSPYSEEGGEKE